MSKELPAPPDFKSEPERQLWMVQNATSFSVIFRRGRLKERVDCKSLLEAEAVAKLYANRNPGRHYMIYAIYGPYDHWVKTVSA